ncbi:hypothetical protein KGQ31_01710 [Patescibacteria group bacterium]|nr:hypothetical protein [Patescibacteria group bacterium]
MKGKKQNIVYEKLTAYGLRPKASRGFALLFAILASSVLISIALAIFNLSSREVVFSTFGRESQVAFYAADIGAECALYWDVNGKSQTGKDTFATSTDSINYALTSQSVTCGSDTNVTVSTPASGAPVNDANNATNQFSLQNAACATVSVSKSYDAIAGKIKTTIESYGHDSCGNPLVERGLRIQY